MEIPATNIPIYTLKELLNNVIDGYTLYSDKFPDFKVIYSSTDIFFIAGQDIL